MSGLLGERDEHLRYIEDEFQSCAIHVRGNEISISGADATLVSKLFEELTELLQRGENLDRSVVIRSIVMVRANQSPSRILTEEILRTSGGRVIRAKTAGPVSYTHLTLPTIYSV